MSQTTDSHPSELDLTPSSRNALRKHLRQLRRALSAREQEQASASLALNLLKNPDLHRARHIAVYLPNDGEIDPHPYMAMARSKGVHFYLPVLHPIHPGRLVFSPYYDGIVLTANRFGILEPAFSKGLRRPAWALDAVMFPLVGFDAHGGRLGMGGGFYDRTFAFTRLRPRLAPKLIGLAHHCQQVNKLPIEPWDVPLHSVVTDEQVYRVK
ncbi:5-formyltetrahydrofolate cyclo-ligase [Marinobacter sp. DY40_1A1]|uniref:5-formyltetrahydrofolate cyclo-ligase n=1 Tax=Marinobacter sp. DY40_1A1 TaxID=2583229 RepID=UPI001907DF98|nr:5-formyltetrahydrofolate cyclo-ligase [Marinobacter sp. DY40_1A1]MBK1886269.1 5-formyltetrahydrofolate cyclo-ligase [Marinobacter sp. DY40_1A1]